MSVDLDVESADAMHRLGMTLASFLHAGDLVVLVGPLGAGKTTLAQGIGAGMGVRGNVTSPTFVIARVHPTKTDGPALVHVDAYRIAGALEIDDLDLDASVGDSVTVVEWGRGLVEGLAPDRLDVDIDWVTDSEGETRRVRITAHGSRWHGVELADLLATG